MDLNEYIRQSYKRPNRKVLEGLGASEELIEYLMETPRNTNWNVIGSITSSGDGDGEVWATSGADEDGYIQLGLNLTPSETSGVGTTTKSFTKWKDLIENANNYSSVKMVATYPSGIKLTTPFWYDAERGNEWWVDGEEISEPTYGLGSVRLDEEEIIIDLMPNSRDISEDEWEEAIKIELIVTKK